MPIQPTRRHQVHLATPAYNGCNIPQRVHADSKCKRTVIYGRPVGEPINDDVTRTRWVTVTKSYSMKGKEAMSSLSSIEQNVMRRSGGAEVQLHVFSTSAQAAHEWSSSRSGHFTHRETPPPPPKSVCMRWRIMSTLTGNLTAILRSFTPRPSHYSD
jgi:hypothetical protein